MMLFAGAQEYVGLVDRRVLHSVQEQDFFPWVDKKTMNTIVASAVTLPPVDDVPKKVQTALGWYARKTLNRFCQESYVYDELSEDLWDPVGMAVERGGIVGLVAGGLAAGVSAYQGDPFIEVCLRSLSAGLATTTLWTMIDLSPTFSSTCTEILVQCHPRYGGTIRSIRREHEQSRMEAVSRLEGLLGASR